MTAYEVGRLKAPLYVAFRTMEGWLGVPVIARIEYRKYGRPWGHWFSRLTPEGAFREVPIDHVVSLESDDYAEELVGLIRVGQELPGDFVRRLHVIGYLGGRHDSD